MLVIIAGYPASGNLFPLDLLGNDRCQDMTGGTLSLSYVS